MRYEIFIPRWAPPSLNRCRGRHWSAEHRLKKEAAAFVGTYALANRVPDAAGRRRVAVVVTLPPGAPARDLDNLDKILLDALVRARLLLDDGARGLDGRLGVEFRRGEEESTTLILEDVPS